MIKTILLTIKQLRYNLTQSFPYLRKFVQPDYKKPTNEKRITFPGNKHLVCISDFESIGAGTITIEGDRIVWDLKGFILDGKKHKGKGDQNESSNDPFFTVDADNVTIRNFFFDNVKESVHWKGKNGLIEKGTFLSVGEDAISISSQRVAPDLGENLTIRKIHFQNWGGDKSLQFNRCKNVTVEDCVFVGNNTGIRWGQEDKDIKHTGYSRGNKFYGVRTCHHASGPNTVLYIDQSSESYKWPKEVYYENLGAKIVNKKW